MFCTFVSLQPVAKPKHNKSIHDLISESLAPECIDEYRCAKCGPNQVLDAHFTHFLYFHI